ncbi:MAG: hypothetical protein KDA85_06730, partial [Planctomycetaceae bacterium]|nr:hypothetical protein [Planctomycetaceae bacterium]
ASPKLVVHSVGMFSASFVPTINDFDRLKEQFRIDKSVWLTQDQFAEYGFVVFKLKRPAPEEDQGSGGSPEAISVRPHPMAFDFPMRDMNQPLFFPTVHIHDGTMPKRAEFDHVLCGQTPVPDSRRVMEWEESPLLISAAVRNDLANQLILKDNHCYRGRA